MRGFERALPLIEVREFNVRDNKVRIRRYYLIRRKRERDMIEPILQRVLVQLLSFVLVKQSRARDSVIALGKDYIVNIEDVRVSQPGRQAQLQVSRGLCPQP